MSKEMKKDKEIDRNDYDSLEMMIKSISRFNDKYESFTTGKVYTDLMGKTASGLLKDAAARTSELSPEDLKKHNYALEYFAAFCMYHCVERIQSDFRRNRREHIGDAVSNVYFKVLKRVRKDLEEKGECPFVRNLISCSVNNNMRDLIDRDKPYVEGKDIEALMDALQDVVQGAQDSMRKEQLLYLLEKSLSDAADEGILSEKEVWNICCYYGFGEGYPRLHNHEIAAKFKCSEARASLQRKTALKKLCQYIRDTPRLSEVFF